MAGNFLDTSFMMVGQDSGTQAQLSELKLGLEKGSDEVKIDTMKRILQQMLQGDPMPSLLMVWPPQNEHLTIQS
jgi:coatomer subunit beta